MEHFDDEQIQVKYELFKKEKNGNGSQKQG